MKKKSKYVYLTIIQSNFGYGWEDESEYKTNSQFEPNNKQLLKSDLKEYRLYAKNGKGKIRTINRKIKL